MYLGNAIYRSISLPHCFVLEGIVSLLTVYKPIMKNTSYERTIFYAMWDTSEQEMVSSYNASALGSQSVRMLNASPKCLKIVRSQDVFSHATHYT